MEKDAIAALLNKRDSRCSTDFSSRTLAIAREDLVAFSLKHERRSRRERDEREERIGTANYIVKCH